MGTTEIGHPEVGMWGMWVTGAGHPRDIRAGGARSALGRVFGDGGDRSVALVKKVVFVAEVLLFSGQKFSF